MSHPSLGLPPIDAAAGDPVSAEALRRDRGRIGERAIGYAADQDATFRDRYVGARLEDLRLDMDSMVNRLADAVAANHPAGIARWAEMVIPRFRKKAVSMNDLMLLFEGLRRAVPAAVQPDAMTSVDAAIDAGIAAFRWHRRIAGDARKRHPLLEAIYKGA